MPVPPVVATAFGGVYYWAAVYFSKGCKPLTNGLLAVELAVTVIGFGIATEMTLAHITLVVVTGMAGLLAMDATTGIPPSALWDLELSISPFCSLRWLWHRSKMNARGHQAF